MDTEPPVPVVPKTEAERAVLSHALHQHFLFAELAPEDVDACVDVMGTIRVAEKENIVVQGERGTRFFVLGEGAAEVRL